MKNDLRDFSVDDLIDFKIDQDGDLYWKGRKIRAGGWTTANRLSLAAVLIALMAASATVLANFQAI